MCIVWTVDVLPSRVCVCACVCVVRPARPVSEITDDELILRIVSQLIFHQVEETFPFRSVICCFSCCSEQDSYSCTEVRVTAEDTWTLPS